MSVTNSPASAILRVRRLSSRRPSGRRASSSCDCCPSREPDEWTEWTTWVGQRRSAGLRSGVGRQSSKDVCVFLAPTCKLRQLGLEDASTFVLRGCAGWAGRTRARALGSSPEPIEYRASIECRYFGDVRAGSGRGESDGVAPTPASFRRGRTKKAVWREYIAIGAAGVGAYLGVLAQQGQSLIVEIVAAAFFLPFGRHRTRSRRPR